jgi:sulfatase maturation enzyme AslB (radical SAM superfamily)
MKINKTNENIALAEEKSLMEDKKNCTDKVTPIDIWWDLIHSDNNRVEMAQALRQLYNSNLPTLGEIIFTSSCKSNCRHCIYPGDYNKFNLDISSEQWKKIIKNIYEDMGIRKFIHSGRSLNDTGIKVLKWMRKSFADIEIGIIDNGVSMLPFLDVLPELQLDWIDISIDGMEKEHDLQRNRVGSFRQTLNTITYLKERHIASKINILICLTKLNKDSIIDLIEFMNGKGFKNFFISPITAFSDYGPPESLKVVGRDFVDFIKNLTGSLHRFQDTWIEFNIFEAEYMSDIKGFFKELWIKMKSENDHLSWKTIEKNNEIYINYYPLSIIGLREFIVNSNGDVIFSTVVRKGEIPDSEVIGSLLSESPLETIKIMNNLKLGFYVNALFKERKLLRR